MMSLGLKELNLIYLFSFVMYMQMGKINTSANNIKSLYRRINSILLSVPGNGIVDHHYEVKISGSGLICAIILLHFQKT